MRRTPLTVVFGTAARVNVLRALCVREAAVTVPALATATGLNVRGLRRVLEELEVIGVIASMVGGGSRRVALNDDWALTAEVRRLFAAERALAVGLDERLRATAKALRPHPISVWLTGSHAADTDEPGEPLCVVVLADVNDAALLGRAFAHRWQEAQQESSLTPVEVTAVTTADLAVARSLSEDDRATIWRGPHLVLAGLEPRALLATADAVSAVAVSADAVIAGASTNTSHAVRDLDALQRAAAIATLVRNDASLIARAHASLERRRASSAPRSRATLDEWLTILSTSTPSALRRLLVSHDERMTRLRQSMPFLDVLHPDERKRFDKLVAKAMNAATLQSTNDASTRRT